MTALKLDQVSKTRGRGRRAVMALRGVSFEAGGGDIVLMEGPSGAGKTTMLTVAAGLLTPDEGRVFLAGRALSEMSAAERRAHRARKVGFVFQRANLLDGLTARENILLAAVLARVERREADDHARRLMAAIGIDELGDRRPDELSGGEEHRVAVARALVHNPSVVFADEPTGNLDSVSGRAVAEALASLARERGVCVIMASHDSRLREFATRRLWMEDGEIREVSP
jgi:putative ABC transport system ATP-binding protein